MGHGVYGAEAASQVYFGKHVWKITRAEAALLAGIVQAPSRYTPKKYPGGARVRQEYVIGQMAEKKFIDDRRKNEMLKEKINIRENHGVFTDSYFKDYVLKNPWRRRLARAFWEHGNYQFIPRLTLGCKGSPKTL